MIQERFQRINPSNSWLDRGGDWRLLARLSVVCGLVMAVVMAMGMHSNSTAVRSMSFGSVDQGHIVEIRDGRGITVLSGEFRSRVDALGNTEKDAVLMDRRGRAVIGEVEIEFPAPTQTHRRAELEVDVTGLPGRHRFAVVIDDRIVGTFITDDRGSFDMELQEGEIVSQAESAHRDGGEMRRC